MYSTGLHRKHRVVPLNNACDLMREDVKALGEKIPMVIRQCVETTNWTSQCFARIEQDFSPIAQRISYFYDNLRSFIKMKEL